MLRRLVVAALLAVAAAVVGYVLEELAWRIQADVRTCRMCGCTDERACAPRPDGFTCYWVSADLCSRCLFGGDDEPGGGWQG